VSELSDTFQRRYTHLAFNPHPTPTKGLPWDDIRKILGGSQRMAKVPNGI